MKKLEFADFDAFASSVREVDCKMMAHNSRYHRWALSIANAGRIEIQFGQLGSGNILEGQSWRDGYLFYMPLSPETRCIANGRPIKKNTLMVMEPGGAFDLSSSSAHEWYSVFVPSAICDRELHRPAKTYVTQPDPILASRFRLAVYEVLVASSQAQNFAHTPAARCAERTLLKICQQVLDARGGKDSPEPPCIAGSGIIRRFRTHLETLNYSDLRVGEIANAIDVPERTLRNAVRNYFATSPKRLIEATVMRSVHRALLTADPDEQNVTSILSEHGIFEFGRFAGRYHQTYGEFPSDSLRRLPGRPPY